MQLCDVNPFAPEILETPWEYYEVLREHAPVHQIAGLGGMEP